MEEFIQLFSQTQTYISLASLTVLVIALDIDNVVFMSILTQRLPREQQERARQAGLLIGLLERAVMLMGVGYLAQMENPLFSIFGFEVTVKTIILLGGGLFLLTKSTLEIHKKVEGEEEHTEKVPDSFGQVLWQLAALNMIFSIDSVITAVGTVNSVTLMIMAMSFSGFLMYVFAKAIGEFITKHPTMKMLALSFLLLIGVLLTVEAIHLEVPKGYIYFAMAFSIGVELLNIRMRSNAKKTHHHPAA